MTQARPSILEQFLILFNGIKDVSSDEPSRLEVFYKQNSQVKDAVDRIYAFLSRGDFERRVFHSSRKYYRQAPRGFEDAYQDYKSRWESAIVAAVFSDIDFSLDLSDFLDGVELSGEEQKAVPELVSPDPEFDDSFDPLVHDGAKALDLAFWAVQSHADMATGDAGETIDFAAKIGLEAYDYLTGTIGLDVTGVFRRWRRVPVIFMPAHVSNAYGMGERGTLPDLLDDAVRSFVFGAPAAAIATCRAALEMILKRHYGLDFQFKDEKGRTRDKGLGDLIILASEKYDFVQGKRLRRLTDDSNSILHNYSRRKRLSATDEGVILEFLKTIKFMIERAPVP